MIASGEQGGGEGLELGDVSSFLAKSKVGVDSFSSTLMIDDLAKADDLAIMCGPSGASVSCVFEGMEYRVSCFSVGTNRYSFMLTNLQTCENFDCDYDVKARVFTDLQNKVCPEVGAFMKKFLNGYTLLTNSRGEEV